MLSKKRILVVDDEPGVRKLLTRFFADFQVQAVESTDKAVEIINRAQCDVVVTDIKMPGKSGIELLRMAKNLLPEIPVIMITGHGDKENAIEALKGGAYDYLEKPFDKEDILYAVKRALKQRKLDMEKQALLVELKEKNIELETINEELQAANEELEATNEELEAAYEELKATEEELRETCEGSDKNIAQLVKELEKFREKK